MTIEELVDKVRRIPGQVDYCAPLLPPFAEDANHVQRVVLEKVREAVEEYKKENLNHV